MVRHGDLRASDADREEVVERLRTATNEGRLSPDELADRVSAALSAVTYADLAATVVDLPDPVHDRRGPSGPPTRGRSAQRRFAIWAISTARRSPMLLVVMIPLVAITGALLIALSTVWLTLLVLLTLCGLRAPRHHHGARARARPRSRRVRH